MEPPRHFILREEALCSQLLSNEFVLKCVKSLSQDSQRLLCELQCLPAIFVLPASVCFCLAVIPVNELVTCISHALPRYFCSPTVSYLLLCLLQSFFSPLLPSSILSMFSSFMALFVYIHSGWKSQTQEDAARNKAAFSLSSAFPFPPPPCGQTGERACLGFPNWSLCQGSLESNPTIMAGWRELAEERERKGAACSGAFQTDPRDGLCGLHCAERTQIYPSRQIIQHVRKAGKHTVAFPTTRVCWNSCSYARDTSTLQRRTC